MPSVAEGGSFRNADGELFDVDKPVLLRDRLAVRQQRGEMLFDRLADVVFGFFGGLAVAESTGNVWGIGKVSLVFRLLLDDDLE